MEGSRFAKRVPAVSHEMVFAWKIHAIFLKRAVLKDIMMTTVYTGISRTFCTIENLFFIFEKHSMAYDNLTPHSSSFYNVSYFQE